MRKDWLIPRRTLLKGAGAALALPLLDVMGWADPPRGAVPRLPVRLGWVYTPHGVEPANFWPKSAHLAPAGDLPPTLEPLRALLPECLILGGLKHARGAESKCPPHGIEMASWLTGAAPRGPKEIFNGTSADQLAAQRLGMYTPLPSLELARHPVDTGLGEQDWSATYFSAISWRSPTQPNTPEIEPRAVYDRMFSSRHATPRRQGGPAVDAGAFAPGGGAGAAAPAGPSLDTSMLDEVMGSATAFAARISADDRRKLDEYLENVRGLEQRIAAIERQQAEAARAAAAAPAKAAKAAGGARANEAYSPLIQVQVGATATWTDWVKVMSDLTVLALQADLTRVVTLCYGRPYGGIYLPEIGVPDEAHSLTHHDGQDGDADQKLAKLAKLERHEMAQFAYLVERLRSLREGPGTLLDNCIITYGSGMGHGMKHSLENLPTIVAGRGGGTIRTGRYVPACTGSFCDLLIGALARAGVTLNDPFGDGTRALPDLA